MLVSYPVEVHAGSEHVVQVADLLKDGQEIRDRYQVVLQPSTHSDQEISAFPTLSPVSLPGIPVTLPSIHPPNPIIPPSGTRSIRW